MQRVINDLAAAIAKSGTSPVSIFWATVTAITTAPATLTLKLDGASTTTPKIRYAASYSPTVGDTVFGIHDGPDLFVLGKLA